MKDGQVGPLNAYWRRRRGRVRWDHKSLPHDDVERFGPNEDWLLAVGSGGQPGRKGASG